MTQQTNQQPSRLPVKWFAILPLLDAIASFFSAYAALQGGAQPPAAGGPSMTYLITGSIFLGVLALAAAAALWIGKPWGWWLATYYFVYTAVRSLIGVGSSVAAGQVGGGFIQYGLPLLIGLIVAGYLYAPGSLEYFGMSLRKRWPSLLLFVAAAAATILLFVGLAAVL